jgi:hypothetical protein
VGNADGKARDYVEVKVTRNPRNFRPDELVFKDIRKHKTSTVKEQCEKIQYNGEWVWAFHGRNTTIFYNPLPLFLRYNIAILGILQEPLLRILNLTREVSHSLCVLCILD